MAKANQISVALTAADVTAIAAAIATLKTKLPFLISLTVKEKRGLKSIADKTLPFVEKTLEIGKSNAKFVPGYTDILEMEKDITFWKALRPNANEIAAITSQLEDTMAAAGSDAYRAALDIYGNLQQAADRNVLGAKSLLEELKPFFEKTRQKEVPKSE